MATVGFNSYFIKLQQHCNKEEGFKYSQRIDIMKIYNPTQLHNSVYLAILTKYRIVHTRTHCVIVSLYQSIIPSVLY